MPSTASIAMPVAIFAGSFVVVGNIDDLLAIHQAESKPIEPTAAPEYIPLDARVGKKSRPMPWSQCPEPESRFRVRMPQTGYLPSHMSCERLPRSAGRALLHNHAQTGNR